MFGLTGEALANRVRAASLGDGFSGHSGRIDMARRIVAAGAPNAAVPAPEPVEARRHGGPLHAGRNGWGGTKVADLTIAATNR